MRKDSRFWLSKARGWAAGLLVASTPFMFTLSSASAGENYFIADEQPVAPVAEAPSASDIYAPPAKSAPYAPPAAGIAPCDTCDTCAGPEPWRLFGGWNDCHEWKLTGFVNAGGTANARRAPSGFNGPLTFNDQHEPQFNQLYVQLENVVDTSENSWDFGGRVDLMYGSDYIFNQVTGWETHDDGSAHWNGNPYYGFVTPQVYGEVAYNDLSVKVGRFYTILGYEVVPSTGNFFYSHSYSMQYGEPFYHVGALATYKYSETTSLLGGLVNGWDAFDRTEDNLGGIGGILWDGGNGLSFALTGTLTQEPTGEDGTTFDDFGQRSAYSFVATKAFNDRWTYVFQQDAGVQENGSRYKTPGVNDAEWYSVNQYLFYTLNDCWKLGTRFEWFRDDDGFRVAGVRPGNPIGTGFAGNFYEWTFGANWTPTTNLTVRPEFRYDWYDNADFTTPLPYNDGTDSYMITGAVDVVYVW